MSASRDDGPFCLHCGHSISREIAFFILRKVVFGGDGIAADWATRSDVVELQRALATANRKLDGLLSAEGRMTAELQALTDEVAKTTALEESAIQLITGLADQVAAAKEDPAQVQALADSLREEAAKLAAALASNTPAAPPSTEAPTV